MISRLLAVVGLSPRSGGGGRPQGRHYTEAASARGGAIPVNLHHSITGDGPLTVVLTHGLAAGEATWSAQVPALAARHRVLTWDLRGHGRSGAAPEPCTIADLAADLRSVLDSAGVERAVVLGHSAGGVVAMQFALDHPQRTAGLVLVGTASECNAAARQFYEDLAAIAEERGMDPVRRRLGVSAEQARQAPTDAATFARVARAMASLNNAPLTPRLGEIRCPTQIIVGDKDFLGAGGSVILHRNIAGSRLAIVPDRGHGIFHEDPTGFNSTRSRVSRDGDSSQSGSRERVPAPPTVQAVAVDASRVPLHAVPSRI